MLTSWYKINESDVYNTQNYMLIGKTTFMEINNTIFIATLSFDALEEVDTLKCWKHRMRISRY